MSMATVSTENVRVAITEATGQTIDATSVQLALVTGTGNPGPDDWHDAEWEGPAASTRVARLLLGPGQVELVRGYYRVWYQFTDSPEIPVRPAGGITIT